MQKNKGPAAPKGVVYFIGGISTGAAINSAWATPYFLKTLSENGWDVIEAKQPQSQVNSNNPASVVRPAAVFLNRRVNELKAQGYKRVVIGGHSWGGWVSMAAAGEHDCAADAALLSAPNTFSMRSNRMFRMALTEFGPALNRVKIPTVLILPDDTDIYDPDPAARGEIAEKHFTEANVPHLVIAKPQGFFGHLAGWLPLFDYRYGTCIQAFLENPKSGACRPLPLTSKDFRSIIDIRLVAGAADNTISSADGLVGKNFVIYTMIDMVSQYYRYVSPRQRMTTAGSNETPEGFTFKDGLHCVRDT